MPRGGKRAGAGRKPNNERFARPIAAAEKKLGDQLPALAENILALAHGGFPVVSEIWEPAGLVTVDDTEVVETDGKAFSVKIKRLAFPGKNADELVLIKRTVSTAAPSLAANQYALDRIMGRPTEHQELSGPDGGAIPLSVEGAIERVYGDKANDAD